jgi:uncharacterized BrkB/YihY/UPF0761 family membrane protein
VWLPNNRPQRWPEAAIGAQFANLYFVLVP